MNKTRGNGKRASFGSYFGPFGPNLDCHFFFFFFFFKNLSWSVTRYHGQQSCTISEKTNDPILRKLGDGQTDGGTEGQVDE